MASGSLQPVKLHCEYQTDPLGIDSSRPRLGWEIKSDRRGEVQSAWRVVAASNLRLLEQGPDCWDSGKVVSSQQNQIEYGGKPLKSNTVYFWKVQVWDGKNEAGNWSEEGYWQTALMNGSDWQARWITSGRAVEEENKALPLFRRDFQLNKMVIGAVVHVSGLGQYRLFVDGKAVGERFLDPAWSVYEKTVYYNTFDIMKLLKNGTKEHTFGVMLGKGFYNTQGDRRIHGVDSPRPLKLIVQAHFIYADGTEERIISDGLWQTAPGPVTHAAILGGEDYDGRLWPAGWNLPGFAAAGWKAAQESEGPGGRLIAAAMPPMVIDKSYKPVDVNQPEPGKYVYDFGQNAAAIPALKVRGQAGQVVRLIPAEQRQGMAPRRNDGKGLVDQGGVGRPNYFQYTLRGDAGGENWQPAFSYSGFQYLQLEGAVPAGFDNPQKLPVVEELLSLAVANQCRKVGQFECSNEMFNRIDKVIDAAVRSNMGHVLTDCPHREKLGWLEVSYLMGPAIAGRYDIARFYGKVSRDCIDSQSPDGMVPTVAPNYPAFQGGFAYTPEWGAAAVVIPWQLWQWYGDRRALAAAYPAMKAFVDYMQKTSDKLIPKPGLGDWYDYGHGKPVGESQFTPTTLSAMATFYRCTKIVRDAAGVLGRADEQKNYETLAGEIKTAFNAAFFDGQSQYKNNGSPQCANSMALVTGLAPEDKQAAVLEAIVADIRQRNNQQTAGDIGFWYLLRALSGGGRSDVIYDIGARTDMGSYGFIVNNGWTSMPEAWDANTGASMNHCMLGHIQDWFMGAVAGIQPDLAAPGWQRAIIRPQLVGDLTWARGEYHSLRGLIKSRWDKSADRFQLQVSIPANMIATVYLPVSAGATVTENGKPLAETAGVRLLSITDKIIELEVGGGQYEFVLIVKP